MLGDVDLMWSVVVADRDPRAIEEFEGKNGLHWRLSCMIGAFTSQEDALAAMVVVHDILEHAEGCLLGRDLLNHELGNHPLKTGLQAISSDSEPFEVMQELRELNRALLLAVLVCLLVAAVIDLEELRQHRVLHFRHRATNVRKSILVWIDLHTLQKVE